MAELLDAEEGSLFDGDDKRRLNLTQTVRERVISEMLKEGKLPESGEDRAFLMKAMDSMDRQTLSKANVKSKDKLNDSTKNTNDMVTQLLLRMSTPSVAALPRQEIPTVGKEITVTPVPGEMDMAGEQMNYDEFVKKFE